MGHCGGTGSPAKPKGHVKHVPNVENGNGAPNGRELSKRELALRLRPPPPQCPAGGRPCWMPTRTTQALRCRATASDQTALQ